jgi:uncharacterized protein (DUF305 family)
MKKSSRVIVIVVAVLITAVSVYTVVRISRNSVEDDSMSNSNSSQQLVNDTVNKGSSTYKTYSQLEGEEYDRMFIANMIEHHKGAVSMANLALTNAKHQEIKNMANDIISAQTKEIKQMTRWQSAWSYPVSSGDKMQDHSAMGMMVEMSSMNEQLEKLSGDEFDKAFLSLMIEHHQSAIDMAYPGMLNAKHEEAKTLTKNIVSAQSKEIAQMKQWQKEWGY